MTDAHYQIVTINTRLREWVPEHDPREKDPAYRMFHAVKRELKARDVPCWRCGVRYAGLVEKGGAPTAANQLGAYQLEAHHFDLEFSLLNAADVEKWWDASQNDPAGFVPAFSMLDGWLDRHPEYKAKHHEDVFNAYMESEGNLMQLCDVCHRSKDQGIHHIPYPDWRAMRIWKSGLPQHVSLA